MEDLQSWWEVPSIAHFCFVFRAAFNLLHLEIEELEEALIGNWEDDSNGLQQLIISLLKGCCETRNITNVNWEDRLRKLLKKKWVGKEGRPHPLPDETSTFFTLPLRTKVEILHALCYYRLEAADVNEALKSFEGNHLRLQPVGKDGQGYVYWYFFGLRLYKEECSQNIESEESSKEQIKKRKQNKKKTKRRGKKSQQVTANDDCNSNDKIPELKESSKIPWSVVCFSFEDWNALIEKLQNSKSNVDKKLHSILETFLPNLAEVVAEREKVFRKKMMELAPRRTSERIDKIKQQKEEEGRLALQTEEAKRRLWEEELERQNAEEQHRRRTDLAYGRARRAEERRKAIEEKEKYSEDPGSDDSVIICSSGPDDFQASDNESMSDATTRSFPSDFDGSLSLETSSFSSYDEGAAGDSESIEVDYENKDDEISNDQYETDDDDDEEDDDVKVESEAADNKQSSSEMNDCQIINGIHTAADHPTGWHYSNSLTVPCDRRYYGNHTFPDFLQPAMK